MARMLGCEFCNFAVLESVIEVDVFFFFSVLLVFCRKRGAGYGRYGDLSGGITIGKGVGFKKRAVWN